jgi:hypothetical protein
MKHTRSHAAAVFPPWSPHKFATAIRAGGIHLLRAIWAERTFKTTNVGFSLSRKIGCAFFTGRLHFQRHGMEPLQIFFGVQSDFTNLAGFVEKPALTTRAPSGATCL